MDLRVAFLLTLIGIFLLIGGLSIAIYFLIKKYSSLKGLRLIGLLPILIAGYFVFRAIYPEDEFFKDDFKEVTQLDFPDEGKIIYKSASYPDQFGDYGSVSIVKLNGEVYQRLLIYLPSFGFTSEEDCGAVYLANAMQEINDNKIQKEYCFTGNQGKTFYVAFISDEQSVILSRQSW